MKKIEGMGNIYSRIKKKSSKKNKRINPGGKIYASSLGCQCDRKLRYFFKAEREDQDQFIWDGYDAEIGESIHSLIQKDALEQELLSEAETWGRIVIDGVTINFRIDGIFLDGRLVEYKTIKNKDEKEVGLGAKRDHIIQSNFYMGVRGFESCLISYFKREDGKHVVTWEINFDLDLYNKTIERIKRIISGKDLVKCKKECYFCNYKDICRSEK